MEKSGFTSKLKPFLLPMLFVCGGQQLLYAQRAVRGKVTNQHSLSIEAVIVKWRAAVKWKNNVNVTRCPESNKLEEVIVVSPKADPYSGNHALTNSPGTTLSRKNRPYFI